MKTPPEDLITETELPGRKVGLEQLQVICFRYYFASGFIEGKRVLEVGCGPGLGLGFLGYKSLRVIGGDRVEDSLRFAQDSYKGRQNIELLLLDAHVLPFKRACFDAVVAMAAVIYFRLDEFIEECHRVLAEDGIFVFCMPNRNRPHFYPSRLSNQYYSVPELHSLINNHHFELKLFGAFSVPEMSRRSVVRDVIDTLMARGVKIINWLAFVPATARLKETIKKLMGYKTFVLKREIADEDIKLVNNIQLNTIDCSSEDFKHEMLYGIARRR